VAEKDISLGLNRNWVNPEGRAKLVYNGWGLLGAEREGVVFRPMVSFRKRHSDTNHSFKKVDSFDAPTLGASRFRRFSV
jgi:hypothetical protein